MTSNASERSIPAGVKREVRQRTGFGCVMCGNPIIQYDHMTPWATVQEHSAENITTLCPKHHDDKTHKRLPLSRVRIANANPVNLTTKKSQPYSLYYGEVPIAVHLGSVEFSAGGLALTHLVEVRGVPVMSLRVQDGCCLLSMRIFDEDDNLVLEIEDNELTLAPPRWDLQFISNTLTIHSARRVLQLQITFDAPSRVLVTQGNIWHDGTPIARVLRNGDLAIGTSVFSNSRFSGNVVDIAFGDA
jgi:hypothetical protein